MSKQLKTLHSKGILANRLLIWYNPNSRLLPWKKSKNPYFIWLSEVILQQTRVAQGTPYYHKFTKSYPTIIDLANAPLPDILKLWEGLGYYSRARNLHSAAKYIASDLGGIFPNNYNDLLKLKGVGNYTAAAIASFAFDEPVAVVDGNVYRVLSRIFGIKTPIDSSEGKKEFNDLAQKELAKNAPADYNQAIMNFGATFCTPKNPTCEICTFRNDCVAYNQQIVDELPFKSKKIKLRNRYFTYILTTDDENIIIQKRKKKDIWQDLFEFPMKESESALLTNEQYFSASEILYQNNNFKLKKTQTYPIYKQILTHQKIEAQFIVLKFKSIKNVELLENQTLISKSSISKYPFPKIINQFLAEFDL